MSIKVPKKLKALLEPIDSVRLAERNVRRDHSVDSIVASLEEFGWHAPLVAQRNGQVLIGNGRLKAALELGLKEVPVIRVNDSNKAAVRRMVADNRASELSVWAVDVLAEFDDFLSSMDDAYLLSDVYEPVSSSADTFEQDQAPPEDQAAQFREKWGTAPGQLWSLGDHRLLCGDATNPDHVERLLAGVVPFLMVTDPPWGVEYDPYWRNEVNERRHGEYAPNLRIGAVHNDDRANWLEAFKLFPGDVVYNWFDVTNPIVTADALEKCAFEIKAQIVWKKPNFPFTYSFYAWQHEACWFAIREKAKPQWTGPANESTVWEIGADAEDKAVEGGHSTQKPLECMARPIRNHEAKDVYDPFLGSGTTLIACEQLKRRCLALEIDPGYVAVSLERWHRLTGDEPVIGL